MAWFRFTQDFNFTPAAKPNVTIGYKAGDEYNVTRECLDKALEAGRGEVMAISDDGPPPAEEIASAPQFDDETLDAFEDEQVDIEQLIDEEFSDDGNEG